MAARIPAIISESNYCSTRATSRSETTTIKIFSSCTETPTRMDNSEVYKGNIPIKESPLPVLIFYKSIVQYTLTLFSYF